MGPPPPFVQTPDNPSTLRAAGACGSAVAVSGFSAEWGDLCTTGRPTALPDPAAAPEGPCPCPGALLGLTLAKNSSQGYLRSSGSSSLPADGEPRPRTSCCKHLHGPGGGAGDRWGSLRTGKGHGEADTHGLPQAAAPALHAPLWKVSS